MQYLAEVATVIEIALLPMPMLIELFSYSSGIVNASAPKAKKEKYDNNF